MYTQEDEADDEIYEVEEEEEEEENSILAASNTLVSNEIWGADWPEYVQFLAMLQSQGYDANRHQNIRGDHHHRLRQN